MKTISRRELYKGLGASLFAGVACPSLAKAALVNKYAEQLQNGEFNWFPDRSLAGPILIIVSIPDQKLHVYRNGIRVAASSCSTGKPGHRTPTGVFKILQKDKYHKSSTYSNAPMPNMNRLTWSGIAIHAGNLPGFPASHGCVRVPMEFSERLFGITKLGLTVVIADDNSHPASVTHPGLVLGDYARNEFHAVDTAIKSNLYAQALDRPSVATSVVVSRADQSITLWDNGTIAATGRAEILQPNRPIGERVYTMTGEQSDQNQTVWSVANAGRGRVPRSMVAQSTPLQRIKAEPRMREEIRRRLQPGMTLVTTDTPASARTRSDEGFVVINSIY